MSMCFISWIWSLLWRHSLVLHMSHWLVVKVTSLSILLLAIWQIIQIYLIDIRLIALLLSCWIILILEHKISVSFHRLTQNLRAIGCRLPDLILWSISWLSHLVVHLYLLVFARIRIESCWTHWIIPTQIWLIHVLHILRLAHNVVCVILSANKALSSSRMWFSRGAGNIARWLFIHWDLLCVISIEKVHTCVWAGGILVIHSVWWLNELTVLCYHSTRRHLLITLSLALITRKILWMSHLIGLTGFSRIIIVLLKLVLIKTCFWYSRTMAARCWAIWIIMRVLRGEIHWSGISILQAYILLHDIDTSCITSVGLLSGIDIIIILYINVVVHVIHMLLLVVLHNFTTLVAALPILLIYLPFRTILLIGYIW